MSITAEMTPTIGDISLLRRFTVDEYHRMIETGLFGPADRVELLNGLIIQMSPHNPPHDTYLGLAEDAIRSRLPAGWILRVQCSITLLDSEPEPDIAIVRGERRLYMREHPKPRDVGLLVEISDSSLPVDRALKAITYAQQGIVAYWIVNLPGSKLEVYTEPSPSGYRQERDYVADDRVPLVLDGREVATIPVREILP